jgi:hypothetical protein
MGIVKPPNAESNRLRTPFEALSQEAQGRLRELMISLDPLGALVARARVAGRRGADDRPPATTNDVRSTSRDLRLPRPGEILRRPYRDREILVRVLEAGFEFEGRRYRSLSAVAQAVTGAHWNGWLFFGLSSGRRTNAGVSK